MKNTTGVCLLLFISGGMIGCTATSNNANLRGANTNTGYVNNANAATPRPASTPLTNANNSANGTTGGNTTNANRNSNVNTNR